MKKLKLLSSLSALVLVLSVGACNSGSSDDSLSAEDSSSSSSVVEEITLNNYTLSFSFVDATGAASTIPEYATAYVIGSWDSWSQFIPLTETEGRYSTTFSTIKEGSYTYKVVEWYTGETVDWSNCVEITTTDQTVVVNASDGDNFTNTITHTISAVLTAPLTDEVIRDGIIGAVGAIEDLSEEWDAILAESSDEYWEEEEAISLTIKDDNLYGHVYSNDDWMGETYDTYYTDGLAYIHSIETSYYGSDESYEIEDCTDEYADFADKESFFEVFDLIDDILNEENTDVSVDTIDWAVTSNGVEYTLIVTRVSEWYENETPEEGEEPYDTEVETFTYVTTGEFELLSVAYRDDDEEEGVTEYSAAKSSLEEVEKSMSGFNPKAWDPVDDVADILARVSEGNNYRLQIEYYEVSSDYYESADAVNNAISNNSLDLYLMDLVVDITYTQDAVLLEYYQIYYYWMILLDVELYVNDYENNQTLFYCVDYPDDDDADVDYTNLYCVEAYDGLWSDTLWSLLDLADYSDSFVKGESKSGNYGTQVDYTINYTDDEGKTDTDFLTCLLNSVFIAGNWLPDYYAIGPTRFASGYINSLTSTFYKDLGEWDITYFSGAYIFTNYYYGSWYEYDYTYASIYDIDRAYIPSTYASYLA